MLNIISAYQGVFNINPWDIYQAVRENMAESKNKNAKCL
jgi:hypothetical protein